MQSDMPHVNTKRAYRKIPVSRDKVDMSFWTMSAEEQKVCDDAKAKLALGQGTGTENLTEQDLNDGFEVVNTREKLAKKDRASSSQQPKGGNVKPEQDVSTGRGEKKKIHGNGEATSINMYTYLPQTDEDTKLVQAEESRHVQAGGKASKALETKAHRARMDALKAFADRRKTSPFPKTRAGFERKTYGSGTRRRYEKVAEKRVVENKEMLPPPIKDESAWPSLGGNGKA